ncbi:MAG TPA: hypothetical protein PLK41_03380 [Defluviitoga tunisiensis]|jgi:hypothetical protein|nr:hypothetical protein [Defluviitoga tunisiensis]MDY0379164.1 hypothetical protein [Defluviitoga tunisiensis]HOB54801.1 hypothetical protein [Defluviitoga tunisiensis]HOP34619.1 hypothetical protein [Defluviitoga tunisiensis]HPP10012.1 hypothetical protein [Defluviitoga tunisiensis]
MYIQDFDFNNVFANLYYLLTNSIYIILPISIFLLFFSKVSSKISIFLIGVYASYSVLIPYLLKIEFVGNFINNFYDYSFFIYLILSALFGFIFYQLFKIGFFIGGFLLGGLAGYSIGTLIISTNNEWLKNIPFSISYIPWIIFLILGFVIAFVFAKNYEIILAVLSVLFGAFILSFYIIYLLEKYAGIIIGNNSLIKSFTELSQPEFLSMLIIFIILISVGFYIIYKTNQKAHNKYAK